MKMTSFFVKNWQFTLVLFIMVIVVSITTMLSMPRAEDPEINPPQFPIIVVYPGTSPVDMEELVVKPIEKRISELEDIKKIKTEVKDGVAELLVEFKYSSNVNDKYQELVREVNSIRDELPQDLYSLDIRKVTPTDVNVIQIALVSENASGEKMKFYAKHLKEKLEKIPSLKKADYHGIPDQQIRIDLNTDKIAQLKIPLNYIIGSIQSEAANIPAGSIRAGSKVFNVKTSGKYKNLEEIQQTVVYSANGKVVLLKDVANVSFQYEEQKHIVRLNGIRAVLVTAAQKSGENIANTQKAYLPVIEEFKKTLPKNIELVHHFDQADNVGRRLSGLGLDFMIAIGLVLITLLPLGWRAALIVMVAIPLSLGLGVVSLNFMGFSLNQLSIVGLVVALGLLVDDSIVVVENIERWLREGHSKKFAAVEATKQITLAVIGTTATLAIAFMPLALLPEASGEFIRSLPLAVISSVTASLLVSLTIIPFLSSRILKTHANPEGNIFLRVLKKLISGSYARLLDYSLKHPIITLLSAILLFIASLGVFGIIGFRLFPTSEKPQFLVNINMSLQSNLENTNATTTRVEQQLLQEPQVEYVTTNIGKGNPRIYYNEIPANEKSDFAQLYVQLKKDVSPKEKRALIEQFREQFMKISGARIEVKDFEQGPPVEAPVAIRISGDNLDTLRMMASRVQLILDAIPGTIYIKNEVDVLKSDLRVKINTVKARTLGIQTADIDRTIRMAISGIELSKYTNEQGDDYTIVLNTPREQHATLENFNGIFINSPSGAAIPLSQLAKLEFETSPGVIKHLDKKRYAIVTAFTDKGVLAQQINTAFEEKKNNIQLPAGYEIQIAGEAETEQEAFGGGFMTVVIATVFLFIMVLILEFKTFKSTLIVLSVIPLGIIGGVAMLWISGNPMSFVAIIGFIGLAGVEVKNSILLVDFTNQLREQGMPLKQAIREAGELRFLPIVLTSLTAIGGLIPIALNSNPLVSPLALVLIGGLVSSTLLSRIVTPVVYLLIPPAVESNRDSNT
ncbi:MAG: efflux RND transporter permease subunit [Bacteroidota bacterium]